MSRTLNRKTVENIVRRAISRVLSIHYDPVLGQGMGGLERRTAEREKAITEAADLLLALPHPNEEAVKP